MEVLKDGLEDDVMLVEALHDEADRLTRAEACRVKPQDGAPVPARCPAWGVGA
ncbi:hypothetical protein [Nonomuraea sp. CA-141351]|uniref:hypothetical protein n=1 Tax=Nonomuraea sp. CA-141351 TaxID=3239996 RepID=UPI003D94E21E